MTTALILSIGAFVLALVAFAVKHRCRVIGHCPCDRCQPFGICGECGWVR